MNSMEANMEIEYKFWAGNVSKEQFHSILETAIEKQYEPMYVCSCDDYYTNQDTESFLRYRKGGTTELTLKQKREGNVVRKEINLKFPLRLLSSWVFLARDIQACLLPARLLRRRLGLLALCIRRGSCRA